ncbi:MAG: thioredoxin domain-containing protein [Bryobacteraceae bacterium]|nr:thioredoxin domain-containing protein [Bryobacteraceae bacterium]
MHRLALLLAACLVVGPAFAQTASGTKPKSALDKAVVEDYIRHLFVWGPQISVKVADPKPSELPGFQEIRILATAGQASQELVFYASADGKRMIQGTIYDVSKSPFEADLNKIKTDLQPSFGEAGAPVVIVMYSDFQCSYCREEGRLIRKEIPAAFPKDVRVYFKDFPLDAIHPWAKTAAIAGRCVFRQKPAAFWDFHDWIFEKQGEVTPENLKEKVMEFGKTKSLEPVQLNACIDNKATLAEVDRSGLEGRALGINSTPTMYVNGRKLVGQAPWPQLKAVIEHEIEYAKTHGGGEKCCEIKLPSPLNQ